MGAGYGRPSVGLGGIRFGSARVGSWRGVVRDVANCKAFGNVLDNEEGEATWNSSSPPCYLFLRTLGGRCNLSRNLSFLPIDSRPCIREDLHRPKTRSVRRAERFRRDQLSSYYPQRSTLEHQVPLGPDQPDDPRACELSFRRLRCEIPPFIVCVSNLVVGAC
jgi:hypothetical protein